MTMLTCSGPEERSTRGKEGVFKKKKKKKMDTEKSLNVVFRDDTPLIKYDVVILLSVSGT